MGLTIGFQLSLRRRLRSAGVRRLVEQLRETAVSKGTPNVGQVFAVGPDFTWAFHFPANARTMADILPPLEGWLCSVDPGEGAESFFLGLCRYRGVPGWRLRGFCKTQYAARHGWEHFLACHRRVILLLEAARDLGLNVAVDDEGGYWKTRSAWRLHRCLGRYDRAMAAFGGVLKDAAERAGQRVHGEIFKDARFERLEAEGAALHRAG